MSTLKSSAEDLTLNADGSGNDVIIQSDGSTKAIVTAEGNVGIGVAPESSWRSNCTALDIGGLAALWEGGADSTILANNVYEHTDTDRKHKANGYGSYIQQYQGNMYFYTTTSGTADTAISATTPLTIANDGDVTVATGNLVIGTAGKGIDFSAQTASSATGATTGDEVLDHYEEGTWTPVFSGDIAFSTQSNFTYTKIGRVVHIQGYLTGGSGTFGTSWAITGLPFSGNVNYNLLPLWSHGVDLAFMGYVAASEAQMNIRDRDGATMSLSEIGVQCTYITS